MLPSSCDSTCNGAYPSLIILSRHGQRQAGLGDRRTLLRASANLAASLCARLYVPPPCRLLRAEHNMNEQSVSCRHTWSHYFNLSIDHDGRSPLADSHARDEVLRRPHVPINMTMPRFNRHSTRTRHRTDGREVIEGYDLAARMVQQRAQLPFVWYVESYYFDWAAPLQAHILSLAHAPGGGGGGLARSRFPLPALVLPSVEEAQREGLRAACRLVSVAEPPIVASALSRFADATGGPLGGLSVLHVRRGDQEPACDTRVLTIMGVLSCSRAAAAAAEPHADAPQRVRLGLRPRLAVFTDETNVDYIRNLTTALQSMYGSPVKHGDALLASILGTADNYLLYSALTAMMDAAGTVLRFGYRGVCWPPRNATPSSNELCKLALVREPRHYNGEW